MFDSSHIELSSEAVKKNIHFLRSKIAPNSELSSVVKGNAYGHGLQTYPQLAFEAGVRHFSVFSASEAYELRQLLPTETRVMIMGDVSDEALEWVITEHIEFFVFTQERLIKTIEIAKKVERIAFIHLEFETGMNRTGFSEQELTEISQLILEYASYLHVKGFCTHFAGAESMQNWERIQHQKERFDVAVKKMHHQALYAEEMHTCCSAASVRLPEMHHDLVRIGIMQYGFWSSPEVFSEYATKNEIHNDPLRRVIRWTSRVMSTKWVEEGEFIGYGSTYLAQKRTPIAIVPIGYAHGFSRSLSNHGRAILHGKRVAVIGIVNMNCLALDISDVDETVEAGDEVVLIGRQGDIEVSVASFGELSEQLNYELLTRLPVDIPRVAV
jgi:alanine racemase